MSTHILLVEPDAPAAIEFDENIRAFMDARVTMAHADMDALTLVEAGVEPDVTLIVWGEGPLRGVPLVRSLRKRLPELPIVLVFEPEIQPPAEVDKLKVQAVLNKPYAFGELPGLLRQAISHTPRSEPPDPTGPLEQKPTPGSTNRLEQEQMAGSSAPFLDEAGSGLASLFDDVPAEPGPTSPFGMEGSEQIELQSLADMLDRQLGSPALDGHVELTPQAIGLLADELRKLGEQMEKMPIILSQDGALISQAGALSKDSATAMARLSGRVWREGATRPTREWLCFSDQIPSEGGERRNIALYSVYVAGDLTLSVGWDGSLSLSTLRSNALEAAGTLGSLLI